MASNSSKAAIKEENPLKTESHGSCADESSLSASSGVQEEVPCYLESLLLACQKEDSSEDFKDFLRNVQQLTTKLTEASKGLTELERCFLKTFDSLLKIDDVKSFEDKQGLQLQHITKLPVDEPTEHRLAALSTGSDKTEQPIQLSEQKSESAIGCFKCPESDCDTCKLHLLQTTEFTQYLPSKETQKIKGRYDCNSARVVYLIRCRKCPGVQYVGHTKRPLKEAIMEYRSRIKSTKVKGKQDVHKHFNKDGHDVSDLQVTVIDDEIEDRRCYWINKLDTLRPQGLNMISP